ncbi:MAG: GDSL-type esterase/lipase family protein [Clostridia bacterium]|jgi:lysophospholipase L1-like esterase|nr:GDSL-type esterase/lipase family protein [Clostridia bacterium]MCI2000950.1 GDSL-type esterase/lipase family protein [Clostridia bacterium]MCI2015734.1 GDSL-type esterase/lipase family protein [Clostridia bacterium]
MKKLVLFGDSITYGYGVNEKYNIASLLRNKYDYTVINSGVNGDTTREALERLEKDVLSYSPDLLAILFGSNDSAMNECSYRTPYEFDVNLRKIVTAVKDRFPKCRIFLITPPPVDDAVFMPTTLNKRLIPYIEAIRKIASDSDCVLCDLNIYFTMKAGTDFEKYLQEDGCHLSEDGYRLFFECLSSVLK